jgi:hypothetical protein
MLPWLFTREASLINSTTATTGGNIISEGLIIDSGVCWSTTPTPTIESSNKISEGAGRGAFFRELTGLTPNTKYYVRAYAINSAGIAYGNEVSFTTLANNRFVGTTSTSGVVPFGGAPYCNYTVEYLNTSVEIILDGLNQEVVSANVISTMHENVIGDCGVPLYPSNEHHYSAGSFLITGNDISINFSQDANSFPQNNSVFNGSISGSIITGTITLSRTSNGLPCVVNIPVQANLTK